MIALSRYAAGIEPVLPGYETWHVVPQIGSFLKIDTRVPSEIGYIDVTIERDSIGGSVEMTVTSPGNPAEVWVPVAEGQTTEQIGGAEAEYVGTKTAYQETYDVYAISEAGTYVFANR